MLEGLIKVKLFNILPVQDEIHYGNDNSEEEYPSSWYEGSEGKTIYYYPQ